MAEVFRLFQKCFGPILIYSRELNQTVNLSYTTGVKITINPEYATIHSYLSRFRYRFILPPFPTHTQYTTKLGLGRGLQLFQSCYLSLGQDLPMQHWAGAAGEVWGRQRIRRTSGVERVRETSQIALTTAGTQLHQWRQRLVKMKRICLKELFTGQRSHQCLRACLGGCGGW